jgi:hypothetical protein
VIAFIIGAPRSGTHWLATELNKRDDTYVLFEASPEFTLSQAMAFRQASIHELYPKLEKSIKKRIEIAGDRHYIDKTQPNLWLHALLQGSFPDAKFIITRRNLYSSVTSMYQHQGVYHDLMMRCAMADFPSTYLGAQTLDEYLSLNEMERFFRFWVRHRMRGETVYCHDDNSMLWDYDICALDSRTEFEKVERFLGLPPLLREAAQYDNQKKWKDYLSPEVQVWLKARYEQWREHERHQHS